MCLAPEAEGALGFSPAFQRREIRTRLEQLGRSAALFTRVREPRATGKCRAPYDRLFPDGGEQLKSFGWPGSTTRNVSRLRDKAGSRKIVGAFPNLRVSSNHQVLTLSCFLFLFRYLPISLQNHPECILQVFTRFFQSCTLSINPRNFFYPGGPPVANFSIRGGQLHFAILNAFRLFVHPPSPGNTKRRLGGSAWGKTKRPGPILSLCLLFKFSSSRWPRYSMDRLCDLRGLLCK